MTYKRDKLLGSLLCATFNEPPQYMHKFYIEHSNFLIEEGIIPSHYPGLIGYINPGMARELYWDILIKLLDGVFIGEDQLIYNVNGKQYWFDNNMHYDILKSANYKKQVFNTIKHKLGSPLGIAEGMILMCSLDVSNIFDKLDENFFVGLDLVNPDWKKDFSNIKSSNERIQFLKKFTKSITNENPSS